jgi:hypothetical protein
MRKIKKFLLTAFKWSKPKPQRDLTDLPNKIHNNYSKYYNDKDLVYFPELDIYGAFKYSVVKNILNLSDNIGVSTIHLALNNIYFSKDERKHQNNKKAAITHLGFLSSKLQYSDNGYTRLFFNKLLNYFPKNQTFDLVYYLINPLILINVLKEYGFLETFPEFDPEHKSFNIENALLHINDFFEDTDKLELIIKIHLNSGGKIPEKMLELLDDMKTENEIDNNNLPRYFRSMIFSAVESTAGFISTLVYVVFNKYPEVLTKENPSNDLYWIANEVLRIYTPVPFIYRTVWKDMKYANTQLKRGDMIVLFLGAANNDPNVFEEPHLFQEHRKEKHLSFGGGGYSCIGRFASFRIALNVLSYLTPYANQLEFQDKDAKHYIHNSMLKIPLKVIYRDSAQ